ncbi:MULTISPECIES: hypothetical protein [unclassified Streptomyces]|uniref:hypothetical protein n=1 Tax=unclassified Streptomyces TaxID=2593676 RepID=UPI002E1917DC
MNPIPQLLATVLGYGLEQFIQSEYGVLGLVALAALTLLLSAERRSMIWALIGAVLAFLALTQV